MRLLHSVSLANFIQFCELLAACFIFRSLKLTLSLSHSSALTLCSRICFLEVICCDCRLAAAFMSCVLYHSLTFMTYVHDYLSELASRDGSTVTELRRSLRPAVITDAEAIRRGYPTAAAYEQALHEFLNGC